MYHLLRATLMIGSDQNLALVPFEFGIRWCSHTLIWVLMYNSWNVRNHAFWFSLVHPMSLVMLCNVCILSYLVLYIIHAFSALTLSVGQQEGHPACKQEVKVIWQKPHHTHKAKHKQCSWDSPSSMQLHWWRQKAWDSCHMLGLLQDQRRLVPANAHDPGLGIDNRLTVARDLYKACGASCATWPSAYKREVTEARGWPDEEERRRACWALCRPARVTSSSELNCSTNWTSRPRSTTWRLNCWLTNGVTIILLP